MSDHATGVPDAEDGAWTRSVSASFRFLFVLVGMLCVAWLVSNIRQIPSDSRAIVYRFGRVVDVRSSGLLIAWPRPIDTVVIVPAADRQIPFHVATLDPPGAIATPAADPAADAAASAIPDLTSVSASAPDIAGVSISSNPRDNGGFLLTGDGSIVHLSATLFYQVSDPVAYALEREHVEPALDRLFIASILSICAARDLDSILVARPERDNAADALAMRERLRGEVVSDANRRLRALGENGAGIGVSVSRVDLSAAIPAGAKFAFDAVLVAAQAADREVADARTYAERATQGARQASDTLLSAAQATAREQVELATTRTAAIAALAQKSPGLAGQALAQRLYNDRIGEILAKAGHVDTIDRNGGARIVIPGAPAK